MKIQERITTLTEEIKDDNTTSLWRVCRGIVENVSQHNKQIIAQMRDYDTHDKEHSEKVLEIIEDILGQNMEKLTVYPEMYEQMLQVLKEYDEDIISINYDDNERRIGKGTYKILSKSNKKALPLNVYGDGMKKAILLMSAVIAAKDGILLLDEFKTAIHTSAMNKTFKWIIESCKKLNVQVFMTSHSKEAIDKVLKCSTECIDDMAVYTLYKDSEGTSVRRLDGKMAIEVQDEMGLELR